MKLSPSFDLVEFVVSETADRLGIDNTPPQEAIGNLVLLCERVLEPLRLRTGSRPVKITSGYRCLELNRAIGSADNSQHTRGEAADLYVVGITLDEVFNTLFDMDHWDQLIREFPPKGWVHVSYQQVGGRHKAMLATRGGDGKTIYTPTGRLPA